MFSIVRHSLGIRRAVAGGLFAATLVLGLTLASASSALAGGGPGGGGGNYITFVPGAVSLDNSGVVTFTGTINCSLPGEAVINAVLEQVAGHTDPDFPFDPEADGLVVDGFAGTHIDCRQGESVPVTLSFTGNHPRGYRPGDAQLALDFDSIAHDPATGYDYPSFQFGIIPVQLSVH